MKWIFRFSVLLLIAIINQGSFASGSSGWTPSFIVGYGITTAPQTQTLRLDDAPPPGLDNRYVGHSTMFGAALFGLALEKQIDYFKDAITIVGIEFDYLRNNAVNGTVEPMVNVSPDFDELRYIYDIHAGLIQATAKFLKKNLFFYMDGYVQAGAGLAINRLSDYREYAFDLSTASPMLRPFGNNDQFSPGFSAGLGVTSVFGQNTRVSLGYRYIFTGRGKFKKSPIQGTSTTFRLSPIGFHFLVLSLSV